MKPHVFQRIPLDRIAWGGLIPMISEANRTVARQDGVLL